MCVYTTPSPDHLYCSYARFSHKVRLKIDWKFLVCLLKCVSLTANKMAAKKKPKTKKQQATQQQHRTCGYSKAKQVKVGEGERGSWRLNSSRTRRLRRQLHLQLCLLSTSCGPRSVFVVCLCLSRSPLSPSLSPSLCLSSRSRFGNFSFVITVSAVDASQWQANCCQAVWKREGERGRERGIEQRLRAV